MTLGYFLENPAEIAATNLANLLLRKAGLQQRIHYHIIETCGLVLPTMAATLGSASSAAHDQAWLDSRIPPVPAMVLMNFRLDHSCRDFFMMLPFYPLEIPAFRSVDCQLELKIYNLR